MWLMSRRLDKLHRLISIKPFPSLLVATTNRKPQQDAMQKKQLHSHPLLLEGRRLSPQGHWGVFSHRRLAHNWQDLPYRNRIIQSFMARLKSEVPYLVVVL